MDIDITKQLEEEFNEAFKDEINKISETKNAAKLKKKVDSGKDTPSYLKHRKRVKAKIKEGGIEYFEDYELLEFMLFSAYPQKDTKPLAKSLIIAFGSVSNVINATRDELKMKGFTDTVATLLAGYREVVRRFLEQMSTPGRCLNNRQVAKNYVHALCFGRKTECVYCIFLNNKKGIITIEKIAEGTGSSVVVYLEELFRKIVLLRAKYIVVGHNHPSGRLIPSSDDLNLLNEINKGVMAVRSYIYDAIITCDSGSISLVEEGYFKDNQVIGLLEGRYEEDDLY
ncbi:MAG: RadC family protein [Clostridia bacterium]|nr:RadC family protein [Clostridia bacterium]